MSPLLRFAAVLLLIGYSAAGKVCGRPRELENAVFKPGRVVYNPQDIVTYTCISGYVKDSGNDKAVCLPLGSWEHATLRCKRRQCPKPGILDNGKVQYKEITYQSVIYFSCHEGIIRAELLKDSGIYYFCYEKNQNVLRMYPHYQMTYQNTMSAVAKILLKRLDTMTHQTVSHHLIGPLSDGDTRYKLRGTNESECLASGAWSVAFPVCEKVTCPYPEIPRMGLLDFYKPNDVNVSFYLDVVHYSCKLNYVLIGSENATCRANSTWSHVPQCRDVKCQRPTEIPNGYMSFAPYRKYNYKEVVTYECNPPYALVGSRTSYCDKDGEWTQKPLCQAPCHVPTPKANVLHNGRKTRVDEISRQQIQHGDIITYYCKNKAENCAYTIQSQCNNGNFTVPACYKKPGLFAVFSSDPSTMTPCPEEQQRVV